MAKAKIFLPTGRLFRNVSINEEDRIKNDKIQNRLGESSIAIVPCPLFT